MPPKPFEHPQLGTILLGNDYRSVPRRNLHPRDLFWQVDRNWAWLKSELQVLPKLEILDPRIRVVDGEFEVAGEIRNTGSYPTDTVLAGKLEKAFPITLSVRGGKASGTTSLPGLPDGEAVPFRVSIADPDPTITLTVAHPRGGTVELPVRRERRSPARGRATGFGPAASPVSTPCSSAEPARNWRAISPPSKRA